MGIYEHSFCDCALSFLVSGESSYSAAMAMGVKQNRSTEIIVASTEGTVNHKKTNIHTFNHIFYFLFYQRLKYEFTSEKKYECWEWESMFNEV